MLGLAACGGAGSHTTGTALASGGAASGGAAAPKAAVGSTGASTTSTTAESTGTRSNGGGKGKRANASPAPGGSSAGSATAGRTSTTSTSAATPVSEVKPAKAKPTAGSRRRAPRLPAPRPSPPAPIPNNGIPPSAQVSGPTPISCLDVANLQNAHAMQVATWEAFDATNDMPVYVDGPYKDAGQATASAQALDGIEEEAAGGLYRVTASLHSNLSFQVNAVARCLSQTSGKGVLTF